MKLRNMKHIVKNYLTRSQNVKCLVKNKFSELGKKTTKEEMYVLRENKKLKNMQMKNKLLDW